MAIAMTCWSRDIGGSRRRRPSRCERLGGYETVAGWRARLREALSCGRCREALRTNWDSTGLLLCRTVWLGSLWARRYA